MKPKRKISGSASVCIHVDVTEILRYAQNDINSIQILRSVLNDINDKDYPSSQCAIGDHRKYSSQS